MVVMKGLVNVELERQAIYRIYSDKQGATELLGYLGDQDFTEPMSQKLFNAAKNLQEKGQVVSMAGAYDVLKDGKVSTYFADLSSKSFIPSFGEGYFKGLKIKTMLRALNNLCDKTKADLSGADGLDDLGLFTEALGGFYELARSESREMEELSAATVAKRLIDDYDERKMSGRRGVTLGFPTLDAELGGLQPGTMLLLCGRQGMGKTSLALDFLLSGARLGMASMFISAEMPSSMILSLIAQKIEGVPVKSILSADFTDESFVAFMNAIKKIEKLQIYFYDRSSKLGSVIQESRRFAALRGVRLIVVDYAQLLINKLKGDNREREVSGISRALKNLAMELKISVVLLSQLNKDAENRKDFRPWLSDTRESEALTHDADYVVFLVRPDYYEENSNKSDYMILAKNRYGNRIGRIDLKWDAKYLRYSELVKKEQIYG